MSYYMSNESIPACEDLLAWVAVPTRKDALVVSVLSINNIDGMVYEDVVAVVRSCFRIPCAGVVRASGWSRGVKGRDK